MSSGIGSDLPGEKSSWIFWGSLDVNWNILDQAWLRLLTEKILVGVDKLCRGGVRISLAV